MSCCIQARKLAKQALKFGGAAKMATRAAAASAEENGTTEPLLELVDPTVDMTMDDSVAVPVIDGQVAQPQPNEVQAEQEDTEVKPKEKKKKRKTDSKVEEPNGVLENSNVMDIDDTLESERAPTSESKSKKRKRKAEDVGGKDDVEEETRASLEKLTFKERAKVEKKARKAEKAAKKARAEAT